MGMPREIKWLSAVTRVEGAAQPPISCRRLATIDVDRLGDRGVECRRKVLIPEALPDLASLAPAPWDKCLSERFKK
jgi:hypothetical protein